MARYQKTIAVLVLMLVFTAIFLRNTTSDFPLIFQKDLLAHDESSNSVVAANLTRKFFPPMVRVNPLNDQQGNWMEGPFWQHIPPLFAYVPYLFFKLDGQVTIEVKRLSYAFLTLLTGLLFIWSVYRYRKSLLAAAAASVAAIFWVNTPFTRELITGYAFGVSDIVLAFSVICGFAAVLWYLREGSEVRREYSYWKFVVIAAIVALPIMAKNLLGAIPAATYFGLLIWDHRQINKKLFSALGAFLGLLALYFLPLYLASPETFKSEILVSFFHFNNLEGWGRAWHYYLTNYLPQRYLFYWTWVYYAGLIFASVYSIRYTVSRDRKDRILLWLAGGWFAWNLLAISLVTSKVPNFIYQSYLLSLFFVVYAALLVVARFIGPKELINQRTTKIFVLLLIFATLGTGYGTARFIQQFKVQRAVAYNYQNEHEKFYQIGEKLREQGMDTHDLAILNTPPNDCWFRYYILFLTGAESKTLLEMHFNTVPYASVDSKYRAIYFIDQDFSIKKISTENLDSILDTNKNSIESEIQRIKKDKTSCQWLVPDQILNAP